MYEQRKQDLVARAKEIKTRLDQIKGRADSHNRDLTYSESREVNELKGEAERLHRKARDIRADEELEQVMNDMGDGIYQGKSATPRDNKAAFNF
jgi:hypothetical protein